MNTITVTGRLTKDVDVMTAQNGKSYTNNSIAVERRFKVNGQKVTDFFSIKAFGHTADYLGSYGAKGARCLIRGEMQLEKNTQTNAVYPTIVIDEIEMIDFKNQNVAQPQTQAAPPVSTKPDIQASKQAQAAMNFFETQAQASDGGFGQLPFEL